MLNFNKAWYGGNLTRDPELRQVGANGVSVVSFSIAINNYYTKDGEKKKDTTFIDCEAWEAGAEAIAKFFKKGSPIFVEGRTVNESWEDKDGNKRTRQKCRVMHFHFVEPKQESGEGGDEPKPAKRGKKAAEAAPDANADHDDNNIPF